MGKKNEEKKLKKRKLHIQRTKILIRYSTHASPSNNFYLNKQSAIVSNPTYKRTTYFSRLTNWTVIPLKIEDTSARLIPPRATILLPWYLNLDRQREREREESLLVPHAGLRVYYAFSTHCIEFQMLFTELYIFIAWQFPRKLVPTDPALLHTGYPITL